MTLGQMFDKAEELQELEVSVKHDDELSAEDKAVKTQRIAELRALDLGAPLRVAPAGLPPGCEVTP